MAAAVVAFATSTVAGLAATPTPPGTPSRPSSLQAVAGDTRVTLTWTAPTLGKPIVNYTVTWSPGAGSSGPVTDTRYVATGLTNGTAYTFKVTATNSIGTGPASAPATATPHATPPGRPTNLGATNLGSGQIRLDWTPPTSKGSMPSGNASQIDHYNVSVSPGATTAQVPGSGPLTYTASGLADNVTYTFQVSATNTRPLTGAAATVYAPLPTGANIGLQPTAGGITTGITVTGSLFLKNESITLYWDVASHVAASVVSDGTGAFTKVVKPFAGDKPKVHKLCASVQPHPCATFTLHGPPTPTPGVTPSPAETPTPAPASTPPASGVRGGGGGLSGLDILTRPPFVFLPILAILGLLGVLAYWLLSRRRQLPPSSAATIVHRATRPDYMAPFPTEGPTPVAAPPPGQPSAWDAPIQSAPPAQPYVPPAVQPPQAQPYAPAAGPPPPATYVPTPYVPPPVPSQAPPPPAPPAPTPRTVEWPAPQNPATAPDEPPDLPQPSD